MKKLLIIVSVFMLAVQITHRTANASEGFEDLVKVVKSGTDERTLVAYIDASPVPYALTVDEILCLNDLGLSTEMIKAVTEHGKQMAGGMVAPLTPTPDAISQPETGMPSPVSLPPVNCAVQETVVSAPVVEVPQPEAVDVSSFYGSLSPYGSWINVEGTWYWQPTAMVVDSSWSPYCQRGHWVYTDCGWMWQSDYSWGWAPFHYGRWHRHSRYGWIWMPDTVWAPAWVSWRHSDSAIGWAPLPPEAMYEAGIGFSLRGKRVSVDFEFGMESSCFTFVPAAQFCELEPERIRLPRAEALRVYNTTTVIQNNYIYNDNRIINNGPSVAHIREVTHRSIKQVKIVDQSIRPGQPIHVGGVSAESVAVYRPHVAPTTRETPQTVVARRQAAVVQVKHEAARKAPTPILETYKSGALTQAEQTHGRASLESTHVATSAPIVSKPSVPSVVNQRQTEEAAAHQRQTEEAAARQHEQQQRRTDELARQQEQKRSSEALDRKQQDEQQKVAQAQRQAEDAAAHQQEQKRNAEALDRKQQEEKQKMAQAQRQTEEAAARQRETKESAQHEEQKATQQKAQQSAFQGYGNRSMTSEASKRGSASSGTSTNSWSR
jgi:hypothetical protein